MLESDNKLNKSIEIGENKGFLSYTENFQNLELENLGKFRILNSCGIENCRECRNNNTCIECSSGYSKKGNDCCLNEEISKSEFIGIMVGSATFLVMFCFLCVCFARKHRQKYSENPGVVMHPGTKCTSFSSDFEVNPAMVHDHTQVMNGDASAR